jgi:ORF6N domain
VMLDSDLARIYGVPTFRLNETVKRNRDRFPADFLFQLTADEFQNLISQIAISSSGHGGRRKLPWAFTEHGALMAANVLRSRRAVEMSIHVIRAFVTLRREAGRYAELARKLAELERKQQLHGEDIQVVFEALRQLEETTSWTYPEGRRLIGFRQKPEK